VTASQVLLGVGLILLLAVGSQVLADRLKIPALIILLPAGFTAGAITSDVNPQRLLGTAFQPLVLFEPQLTRYEVSQRYAGGARVRTRPAGGGDARADGTLLFLVRADGLLAPVTRNGPPEPRPGDTMILLGPTAGRS
jgi:hypothetical protein